MRRALTVVLLAATVSAMGCGSDAPSATCDLVSAEDSQVLRLRMLPETERVSEATRKETIEALCRRLHAVGAEAEIEGDGPGGLWVRVEGLPEGLTPEQILVPRGDLRIYDWEASLAGSEEGYPTRPAATGAAPEGAIVLAEELPVGGGSPPETRWFTLRDRPGLTREDVRKATAELDEVGSPALVFELTAKGKAEFRRMTRTVARRGRAGADGPVGQGEAERLSNHFAVALDDLVITRPIVNFAENPDGIDGGAGVQISGAFDELGEASAVAAVLTFEPPPVRLEPVRGGAGY